MKKYISILLIVICLFSFVSCNSSKKETDILTKIKDTNRNVDSYQISLNITSTKKQYGQDLNNIPMTIHGSLQQNNKSFSCSLSMTENNLYQYGNHKNDKILNKKINGDFDGSFVSMEIQTEQGDVIREKSESKSEKIYSQLLSTIDNEAVVEKEEDYYKIKVKQEDFKKAFNNCNEIAFNTVKDYIGTIATPDPKIDFEYIFDENFYLKKIAINSIETIDEEFDCLSNIEILFEKNNEKFEVKKETLKDNKRIVSEEENNLFNNLSFFTSRVSQRDNIKNNLPQITLGKKIDLSKGKKEIVDLLKESDFISFNESKIGTIYEYNIDGATLNVIANDYDIDMEVLINNNTDQEFSVNEFKLGSTKKDDVTKKYNNSNISTFGDKTVIELTLNSDEEFESNIKLYFNKDGVLYGFRLYMYVEWNIS